MNNRKQILPQENTISKKDAIRESFLNWLLIIAELSKIRITFFVAISTFIGALLFDGFFSFSSFAISMGVFLLASGSSALNHFQEREYDKIMTRTKNRPIPSGRISDYAALSVAIALTSIGVIIIAIVGNLTSLVLGALALAWYNIFYTPLKRKFAMAVVPGSVIGAIPPVIGWVAMGGNITDHQIILVSIFFFMWQIPHFWLLLMMYDSEYKSAGFPTLSDIFSMKQMQRLTFIWIATLAIGSLALSVIANYYYVAIFILVALSIWILYTTFGIMIKAEKQVFKKAFMNINIFVLVVILLLTVDNIIH